MGGVVRVVVVVVGVLDDVDTVSMIVVVGGTVNREIMDALLE